MEGAGHLLRCISPLPITPTLFPHTAAAATWEERWKKSSWKEAEGAAGEFKLSAGESCFFNACLSPGVGGCMQVCVSVVQSALHASCYS